MQEHLNEELKQEETDTVETVENSEETACEDKAAKTEECEAASEAENEDALETDETEETLDEEKESSKIASKLFSDEKIMMTYPNMLVVNDKNEIVQLEKILSNVKNYYYKFEKWILGNKENVYILCEW